MSDRELKYEAENDELGVMAQVYTNDGPQAWMVQFIDTDADAEVARRFFTHYDDAEAHADAFCFGG
jgi:hypothetical protein